MSNTIHATINGLPVAVTKGTTILDAARQVHVRIPTLCKHPDLDATGACGICIVQIKNNGKMLRACCTAVEDKMEVLTETPEICLLYTSDAADEEDSVDLGGRRI